ncbi:MAG: MATE family efflux transporter [Clostridiales bacterium]|nr:MATE family efflux transporter [Clostridiales bacterium]
MVRNLTKGKPLKQIIFFALPIFIGNVFQQLYSMVDNIIVGNTLGENAFAGVGATTSIAFLIIGFVQGLTAGFAVKTSQYFGNQDEENVKRSVATSFVLCAIITVVLTLASVFSAMPLLRIMQTPEDIIQYSYDYIVIVFAGLGATMLYNLVSSILRSLGDSKIPLIFLIIASVINVALDLLFIIVFKMGVAGAGWATIISQFISAIACAIYMFKKYEILRLNRRHFKMSLKFCWQHLNIGLPMAFQYSIIAVGIMVQQSALNTFGTLYVSAYTAASKIDSIVTQALVAMGSAVATYVGQNYGAGQIDRINKGINQAMLVSVALALVSGVIVYFGSNLLTGLFVKDPSEEMLALSKRYLFWQGVFYIGLAVIYIYRNGLQGMGYSVLTMVGGVVELSMRVVASLLLVKVLDYLGLCLSNPCAWLGVDVLYLASYYVIIHNKFKRKALVGMPKVQVKKHTHSKGIA